MNHPCGKNAVKVLLPYRKLHSTVSRIKKNGGWRMVIVLFS